MTLALTYWESFSHKFLEECHKLVPGHIDLRSGIMESLYYGPRFTFTLFGQEIRISDTAISMWISMLVILLLAFLVKRSLSLRPTGTQTIAESLLQAIINAGKESGMTEEQARTVVPYVATIGIFITLSNIASIFDIKPPAQNPIFAITLAFYTLLYIVYKGVRLVGFRGFWHSLVQPMPALLPFKLLDYLIKPVSLAFRLFGNIFGAYVLMKFIGLLLPMILPAFLGLWFDLGDGIVQGIIFSYLTITYIGEIVEGAHETE